MNFDFKAGFYYESRRMTASTNHDADENPTGIVVTIMGMVAHNGEGLVVRDNGGWAIPMFEKSGSLSIVGKPGLETVLVRDGQEKRVRLKQENPASIDCRRVKFTSVVDFRDGQPHYTNVAIVNTTKAAAIEWATAKRGQPVFLIGEIIAKSMKDGRTINFVKIEEYRLGKIPETSEKEEDDE